jgi:hypothetical protein
MKPENRRALIYFALAAGVPLAVFILDLRPNPSSGWLFAIGTISVLYSLYVSGIAKADWESNGWNFSAVSGLSMAILYNFFALASYLLAFVL